MRSLLISMLCFCPALLFGQYPGNFPYLQPNPPSWAVVLDTVYWNGDGGHYWTPPVDTATCLIDIKLPYYWMIGTVWSDAGGPAVLEGVNIADAVWMEDFTVTSRESRVHYVNARSRHAGYRAFEVFVDATRSVPHHPDVPYSVNFCELSGTNAPPKHFWGLFIIRFDTIRK